MGNLCVPKQNQEENENQPSQRKFLSGQYKETIQSGQFKETIYSGQFKEKIQSDDRQNDNQDKEQDDFYDDSNIETIELPELIESDITRPSYQDFKIIKQIGQGSFGKVYLVCKMSDRSKYAMKILQKDKINSVIEKKNAIYERKLLEKTNQQFLVNLKYAFQSNSRLFLVMDFIQGGDLKGYLSKHGPFSESQTQFYIAEIFLAIESLHSRNIIYRDLKPANILIDSDGHIKLTDFGLAKELEQENKTFTLCGTPEYIAPEILRRQGYDKMVDYWSMGIVCFELITCQTPFIDSSLKKIIVNIRDYNKGDHKKLISNIKISKKLESLICGLLNPNPRERLGTHGVQEFKNHLFFQGFSWKDLEGKKIQPPLQPQISSFRDSSYFIEMESSNKSVDICKFKDFTYEKSTTESSQQNEDKKNNCENKQLRLKQ